MKLFFLSTTYLLLVSVSSQAFEFSTVLKKMECSIKARCDYIIKRNCNSHFEWQERNQANLDDRKKLVEKGFFNLIYDKDSKTLNLNVIAVDELKTAYELMGFLRTKEKFVITECHSIGPPGQME